MVSDEKFSELKIKLEDSRMYIDYLCDLLDIALKFDRENVEELRMAIKIAEKNYFEGFENFSYEEKKAWLFLHDINKHLRFTIIEKNIRCSPLHILQEFYKIMSHDLLINFSKFDKSLMGSISEATILRSIKKLIDLKVLIKKSPYQYYLSIFKRENHDQHRTHGSRA